MYFLVPKCSSILHHRVLLFIFSLERETTETGRVVFEFLPSDSSLMFNVLLCSKDILPSVFICIVNTITWSRVVILKDTIRSLYMDLSENNRTDLICQKSFLFTELFNIILLLFYFYKSLKMFEDEFSYCMFNHVYYLSIICEVSGSDLEKYLFWIRISWIHEKNCEIVVYGSFRCTGKILTNPIKIYLPSMQAYLHKLGLWIQVFQVVHYFSVWYIFSICYIKKFNNVQIFSSIMLV